jgi:2-C-methyl-D-erythritol 2,4-cyclodiphosphate synthase
MRIGFGYDVHKLVEGRALILGGIEVPHHLGLLGHSDADVLTHAIMDAMLGALALGDIGKHFPDTDVAYKGADSLELLKVVVQRCKEAGYVLGNVDATVAAQQPKLAPYIERMRTKLAEALEVSVDKVSVKATTTEKLGFEGREEGISTSAVVLMLRA